MSSFFDTKKDSSLQEGIIGCLISTAYLQKPDEDGIPDFLEALMAMNGRNIFIGIDTTEVAKNEIFVRKGMEEAQYLMHCCNKISEEWKPAVFAICVDLIFKDHLITDQERVFLKKMKEFLNLNEETTNKIIEVVSYIYKGKI